MKPELKSWCQQHHAECLAQLAGFTPARETLRADPSIIPALEAVAEGGLSEEARQFAEAALLALSDTELISKEGQKHVMLSCASKPSSQIAAAPGTDGLPCLCRSMGRADDCAAHQRVTDPPRLRAHCNSLFS